MRKPWYRAYLLIWGVSQATWGNLARFWALVGVRRAPNPVRCAPCVHRACRNFALWGGFVCTALYVHHTLCVHRTLCVCHALCVHRTLCVRCAPLCVCRAPENDYHLLLNTHFALLIALQHFSMTLICTMSLFACGNLYLKALKSWV